MARPPERDAPLMALERQRQFALDCSQVELARQADALLADEATHERLAADLESGHLIQRTLAAAGQRLSSDALQFAFYRGRIKSVALNEAAETAEKSRARVVEEQRGLAQRLEEVRIIERLRERRIRTRRIDQRRRAQARLDELAIIKSWNGEDTWP